jgi:hypothetical protein
MSHADENPLVSVVAPSHVIPDGSLPLTAMQEELSRSYVRTLASATGLTVGDWSQDYDCIDVTLSSSVDYSPGLYGPKIDIQLKCTGQEAAQKRDHISWSLDSRAYRKMSALNRATPSLFCVLVAPPEAGQWLRSDDEGLLSRTHMYWAWAHEFPTHKAHQETQTVHLPLANLLTPKALLDRVREASEWRATF